MKIAKLITFFKILVSRMTLLSTSLFKTWHKCHFDFFLKIINLFIHSSFPTNSLFSVVFSIALCGQNCRFNCTNSSTKSLGIFDSVYCESGSWRSHRTSLGDFLLITAVCFDPLLLLCVCVVQVCACSFLLFFDVPDDVMLSRLLERGKTSGRPDDNEETIAKRLDTFHTFTQPILDHYGDTVKKVYAWGHRRAYFNAELLVGYFPHPRNTPTILWNNTTELRDLFWRKAL